MLCYIWHNLARPTWNGSKQSTFRRPGLTLNFHHRAWWPQGIQNEMHCKIWNEICWHGNDHASHWYVITDCERWWPTRIQSRVFKSSRIAFPQLVFSFVAALNSGQIMGFEISFKRQANGSRRGNRSQAGCKPLRQQDMPTANFPKAQRSIAIDFPKATSHHSNSFETLLWDISQNYFLSRVLVSYISNFMVVFCSPHVPRNTPRRIGILSNRSITRQADHWS